MATGGIGGPNGPLQSSLRNRQIAALTRMLNLNVAVSKSSVPEPAWKILVYDSRGQDIISPLMNVKELRDHGVTLHLSLDSSREPVPDVSVVYFLVPNQNSIARICRDLNSHIYDSYYFNFISPISRPLLEELAKTTVDTNSVSQVTKIFDQYVDFIALEDDFFVCRHQGKTEISYHALNRADAKDTDINHIKDIIVDSLFSVFVTVGVIPIIRCSRNNAAEMVAEALDKKIRDNCRDHRNSMFTGDGHLGMSYTRPLLVILDRNLDLATPLHHSWTYQALVHDVFDLELNRTTIPPSEEEMQTAAATGGNKTYDLHSNDRFWYNHKGSPFPTVADSVQSEVSEYRAKEDEITKLRTAMGMGENDDPDMFSGTLSDSTARLTSAISSLPELMERKKSIDMHTNIATALLDQIKSRKLDLFFDIEDKLISKSSTDKSVLDVLSDASAGNPEDKLRLFLIYYLLQDIPEQELAQHISALEDAGADISSVEYVKRFKAYSKMSANQASKLGATGVGSGSMSMFKQFGSSMLQGVKNLVIKTKDLPVTRILDQLMDLKPSKETEDFKYFDPRLLKTTGGDSSYMPKSRAPFQEAFVFVVGGGNYIEYQNLQDYCSRQQLQQKKITYGTTELMNASEFLAQLSQLTV